MLFLYAHLRSSASFSLFREYHKRASPPAGGVGGERGSLNNGTQSLAAAGGGKEGGEEGKSLLCLLPLDNDKVPLFSARAAYPLGREGKGGEEKKPT